MSRLFNKKYQQQQQKQKGIMDSTLISNEAEIGNLYDLLILL
jgi:hypothetical protein